MISVGNLFLLNLQVLMQYLSIENTREKMMYWLTPVGDGGAIMTFDIFRVDRIDTVNTVLKRLRSSPLPEADTSL